MPPVEDPKNVVFVTPSEPVIITSRELTGTPNTPIEIVTQPVYGSAEVRSNGSLVYTSNLTDAKSSVVDVVAYKFTNLSGEVVIARKEFVLEQSGDVPRIIQTGQENSLPIGLYFLISALILVGLLIPTRFTRNLNWVRRGK